MGGTQISHLKVSRPGFSPAEVHGAHQSSANAPKRGKLIKVKFFIFGIWAVNGWWVLSIASPGFPGGVGRWAMTACLLVIFTYFFLLEPWLPVTQPLSWLNARAGPQLRPQLPPR